MYLLTWVLNSPFTIEENMDYYEVWQAGDHLCAEECLGTNSMSIPTRSKNAVQQCGGEVQETWHVKFKAPSPHGRTPRIHS